MSDISAVLLPVIEVHCSLKCSEFINRSDVSKFRYSHPVTLYALYDFALPKLEIIIKKTRGKRIGNMKAFQAMWEQQI